MRNKLQYLKELKDKKKKELKDMEGFLISSSGASYPLSLERKPLRIPKLTLLKGLGPLFCAMSCTYLSN